MFDVNPSQAWLDYFRQNAAHVHRQPWERGPGLSGAERRAIAESIRVFQRGEEGTGRTIGRFARAYAERSGDADYPTALQALFDEETRHARDLGRFMELAGIPRLRVEISDGAFRFLRHRFGLDGSLRTLIPVEAIARVYYRALHAATGSPLLRSLCAQILRDETQHLRFHGQRLAMLRRSQPVAEAGVRRAAHFALFWATVTVVALRHRSVLAAGLGRYRYFKLCRREWLLIERLVAGSDEGAPTRTFRSANAPDPTRTGCPTPIVVGAKA